MQILRRFLRKDREDVEVVFEPDDEWPEEDDEEEKGKDEEDVQPSNDQHD